MTIEQKIKSIISEVLNISTEKIKLEDNLTDLVNDSIQLFELLVKFENELGEKVNYDDIANIESVKDIVDYAILKNYNTLPLEEKAPIVSQTQFS